MEKTRAKEDLAEPEVKVVKVEGKKKKDTGPREPTPEELRKAIMKTYREVGGEPDSSMGLIAMLTFVEKTLESAMIKLDSLPVDLVQRAEKQKNKERREDKRREKVAEQKAAQERKTQKVLARSTQPVKKRVGKPCCGRPDRRSSRRRR